MVSGLTFKKSLCAVLELCNIAGCGLKLAVLEDGGCAASGLAQALKLGVLEDDNTTDEVYNNNRCQQAQLMVVNESSGLAKSAAIARFRLPQWSPSHPYP
jgi:hypothetical protein